MSLGLQIEVEEIAEKIVLHLESRIDAGSAPILEQTINQLIDEKHYHLLLNFTRVHYLSSSGMRVLVTAWKKVKAKNGFLGIFSVTDNVSEIVRLSGLDQVLPIFENKIEALRVCS